MSPFAYLFCPMSTAPWFQPYNVYIVPKVLIFSPSLTQRLVASVFLFLTCRVDAQVVDMISIRNGPSPITLQLSSLIVV